MSHDRSRLDGLLAVAAGGALGAPARYGVSQLIHAAPGTFPWATFWTNVSGSFALGVVLVLATGRLVPFLATGFLGAYTTFSTFAVETDVLVKDGHAGLAALYVAASVMAGLLAAAAGVRTARRL